ncbi:uncharacterized protein B0H18DRAFT_1024334 [Fomitopsis serialis]|uniref:uncharacterized protein n=1 Tax=Fomitopsis serialis TaxID=139415 RepID=UPI002008D960|nr:uncharacterized protein B0H18DRAFT_1024334 [Neoantrodia serialis]KAH9920367.1 hypothetical protein B0H18DRAFT_1024334 [Neoantrodia serialis]
MDLDNDEDTETTDSESESSKDVMSEPGWIHYQPPTYSRQAYPRFPYELIERIMDFLWDDPGAFAGCCLVCHAWYCATRPLFPTMTDRKFTDKTRFMQFVRLLARPRNWPYFKAQLTSLELHRQFAHSWVMHIPVCLLPQIMRLTFCDVDWATINPHPQHFLRLSHCKDSLQFLALYRCRFRSTLDLRRMINALPNLSDVTLDAITFQHPSPPRTDLAMSTVKMAHHKLRGMRIWNPCYDATNSIASGRVRLQGFLDLCSAYPAINDLSFDLWHFTSLPEIEDYLRRFRNLSSLSIHLDCADDTYPDLKSAPVDMAAGGHTDPVHPLRYSLSEIKIGFVSSRCALQLLTLVSPRTCHPRLRTLVIKLADPPCAELIAKVTNILQISGAVLEAFDWRHGST